MPDTSHALFEYTRVYLAVFYTCVALFYTLRIVTATRQTHKAQVFAGPALSSTWWNHSAFRFFRTTIWMVCVFRVFFPELDTYLVLFKDLEYDALLVTGLLFLTTGFVCTVILNLKMGDIWRSGIDPSGPSKLITSGAFSYSRNPMFLCVALAQLGFFFALPSLFSLVCLAIGLTALYRQVLSEEAHLTARFSGAYLSYQQNVRRWL